MAQHIIKLTEKQAAKMAQIQVDKKVLGIRESDLVELILDNAGIPIPVDSAQLDGNKLIVTVETKPAVDPATDPVKEEVTKEESPSSPEKKE